VAGEITVFLADGESTTGTVFKSRPESVTLQVSGTALRTYKVAQIKRIEQGENILFGAAREKEPDNDLSGASSKAKPSSRKYTILRQWKPNNYPNGYGAEILLTQKLNEMGLVALIKKLSEGRDPVIIRIFSTRAAYDAERNETYGDAYARGYILFYVKNLTGRGAYRGFNEIRWMQEKGQFSKKFGKKTKM
jgi:hypothetical protein